MAWVDAISWLTAAWLFICAWQAALALSRGRKHSISFLVMVHALFCGVPLLLDVTVGRPRYGVFSGFFLASQDSETVLIYCAYVAAVPIVLYVFGRTSPRKVRLGQTAQIDTQAMSNGQSGRLNLLLWIVVAAPVVAALASPQPEFYLSYGSMATDSLGDLGQSHSVVAALCLLAIVSGVGILLTARSLSKRMCVALGPWMIAACWLFGKRFIVAVLVLGLVYAWWYRGFLMGRRFVIALAVAAMFVAVGSHGYQKAIRQLNVTEFDAYYSNVRVDFGRDVGIRQAIYAELGNASDRILDYRGQSLLFYGVMFVPRAVWPEKPWPYAVYQTARALGLPAVKALGWGVTTSWLDEAIANFGWYGLFIGPLFLAILCRIGDQTGDPFTRYVTVSIGTLFMAVQLVSFAPLAVAWVMLCVWRYGVSRSGLNRKGFPATLPQRSAIVGW